MATPKTLKLNFVAPAMMGIVSPIIIILELLPFHTADRPLRRDPTSTTYLCQLIRYRSIHALRARTIDMTWDQRIANSWQLRNSFLTPFDFKVPFQESCISTNKQAGSKQ